VLLADLDHVDGPREARLVRVRRVTTGDHHSPRGIEPALDVIVHVLASNDSSPPLWWALRKRGEPYSSPLTTSGDINERSRSPRFRARFVLTTWRRRLLLAAS
jgi:hypothetical protein